MDLIPFSKRQKWSLKIFNLKIYPNIRLTHYVNDFYTDQTCEQKANVLDASVKHV